MVKEQCKTRCWIKLGISGLFLRMTDKDLENELYFFHKPLLFDYYKAKIITMVCVHLHSYLRRNYSINRSPSKSFKYIYL